MKQQPACIQWLINKEHGHPNSTSTLSYTKSSLLQKQSYIVLSTVSMTESKTAIILAAGRGNRMGVLTKDAPKAFLNYKNELIVNRLIRQLDKQELEKIIIVLGYHADTVLPQISKYAKTPIEVVRNKIYPKDYSSYSTLLALEKVDSDTTVVIEGDTVMEDALVNYICSHDFTNKSVIFTRGEFKFPQYGAIVKSDLNWKVIDYLGVEKYSNLYQGYTKYTNILRVGKSEINAYTHLLVKQSGNDIKDHYIDVWGQNINSLESYEADVQNFRIETFNTPEEYSFLNSLDVDYTNILNRDFRLEKVEDLRAIEGFEHDNLRKLTEKIVKDNVWTTPIRVEGVHKTIMDGHHRFEVAKALKLKHVPVQPFSYHEVPVWSVRKEETVSPKHIIENATKGLIYPPRTAKHKFPAIDNTCIIPLDSLR